MIRFESDDTDLPEPGEPRGPLPARTPQEGLHGEAGFPQQPVQRAPQGAQNSGSQAGWNSGAPRPGGGPPGQHGPAGPHGQPARPVPRPSNVGGPARVPGAGSPGGQDAPHDANPGPRIQHPRRMTAAGVQPPTPQQGPGAPAKPAHGPSPTATTPNVEGASTVPPPENPESAEAQFLRKRSPNDLAALQDGVDRGQRETQIPAQFHAPLNSTSISPRHKLETWLAVMAHTQASDLILRAGGRPSLRINGRIQFLPGRVPGPGPLLEVLEGVMGERRMETWRETGSADAGLQLDGLGRFRLNAYRQLGEPAVVLRRINEKAPSLNGLDLPAEDLKRLAQKKRGLVLVTGIAGSGKSTTLSAMIEHMNQTVERHVVTLEDPVELLFTEERCVISQREVGTDCMDFQDGLRHALRQSPDVILIGEMRDAETVSAALDATETGHLVLSTLHTINAPQTVERILSFFPARQHEQIRQRLADNLAGVLSQRLVPTIDSDGLVPAYELMITTPHVRELLSDGATAEIGRVIEAGAETGLVSFNQVLKRLVLSQRIHLDDALAASDRPEELVLALRGITGSSQKVDASKARELRKQGGGDGLRMA